LSEAEVWKLAHDIGTALSILHTGNWMHLDVSPGNILIGPRCFKLSDFGTLTQIGRFEAGMEGAGPYVSPEALSFPCGGAVTGQTDIFSLGLVLLEVVTGISAPRGGSPGYMQIRNGEIKLGVGKYTCSCSQRLIELINAMIDPDPGRRPTSSGLAAIEIP
jgi:serine/threonine protein kinase